MRRFFVTAFVLSAVLALAASGFALERVSRRVSDDARAGDWAARCTCSIIYYNFCTGWMWLFSFDEPVSIGVCFHACCGWPPGPEWGGALGSSWHYFATSGVAGYGFTGTVDVVAADANGCPVGAPIASQNLLPVAGWNGLLWGAVVPVKFIVRFGTAVVPNYAYVTDHPLAGPTGPTACGTCYPTTRVNHSFLYTYGPYVFCPGSTFFDGLCEAQLYWDSLLSCCVGVEPQSWGRIKSLYR